MREVLNKQQQQEVLKRIKNYVYKTNELLGAGNFSKVYLGTNQLNNEQVAIKVVTFSSLQIQKLKEMHQSQVNVLLMLNHPNVIKCYDVINTQHKCFIVTQLCTGGDLDIFIKKKGFLTEKLAAPFIKDIQQGLNYLNSINVVHRDLKPANVLISNGRAKIADFGFAVVAKQNFSDLNIGSPLYMSPEGYIDCLYGPKTDVWAFGVLIYELFHGDTPYSRCKLQNDLKYHLALPFDKSKVKPNLSQELKELIFLCLSVDENKRITIPSLKETKYFQYLYNQAVAFNAQKSASENQNLNPFGQVTKSLNKAKSIEHFNHFNIHFPQQRSPNQHSKMNIGFQNNRTEGNFTCQPITHIHPLKPPKTFIRPTSNQKVTQQNRSNQKIRIRIASIDNKSPLERYVIFNSSISFKAAVNILHYCRGIFRCLQIMIALNDMESDIRYLTNWLILVLEELNRKINQNEVIFEGMNSTLKASKLREVRTDYQKKYVTQLKPYVGSFLTKPSLDQIRKFLLIVCQKYDNALEQIPSKSLYELEYILILVYDATRLLIKCKQKGEITLFQHYKDLQQALVWPREKFNQASYQFIKKRRVNNY